MLSPKSPLFLLLVATPLMLGSPPTRAAKEIAPTPTVLAQTAEERKAEADRLLQLGGQQYQVSQFREALQSWEAALQIYREIGDRNGQAPSLNNLGIAYDSLGQYNRAIDFYQQSLTIFQEIGDRNGEAASLNNLGEAYRSQGQYDRAIDFYQQSLAIAREIGDRNGEANSLNNLAIAYESLGQYDRALEFYQQSLTIDREIGDRNSQAKSLNNLGNVYNSLGQYERALELYQQSLPIFQEIGDRKGEAASLGNLGNVYNSQGQYERALDFYQQSLPIFQEIGDRKGEANSLTNLGVAYNSLGQYERALELYQQSLTIFQEIGDRNGEANSLNNLAIAYESLGQYDRALEFYQQSLTIDREIGDRNSQAKSLNNLGSAYNSLGQYDRAIELYQQSLTIAREIGDRNSEAKSLNNLGSAYNSLGQYDRAIDFHQQSLAIKQEIGALNGEANSLGNLGSAYNSLGQYDRAIDFHQQSLAIKQEIGDRKGEANSLTNLGVAYNSLGQYERALELYQQSLTIFQEIGNLNGEANSLNNLAIAYDSLGQYDRALELYQQSLTIFQEIGDRNGEAASLGNLGNAYNFLEQYPQATEALFAAISVYESLRYKELPDTEKIAFYDTQIPPYRLLQQSLIAQGEIERALEISERGRARAFVSLIAQKQGLNATGVPLPPPSIAQIQQLAQRENVTLVQYSDVSSKNYQKLFVWVVQPTGTVHFRQIDLTSLDGSLSEFVTATRDTVGIRGRNFDGTIVATPTAAFREQQTAQQRQSLQQLHQLLIEPISDLLPTDPEAPIVFVPHRSLFLVPFPALINADGEYLIQNHTILTTPSIQVLELTRQARRGDGETGGQGEILVVGNPTMPHVWNPDTNKYKRLSSLLGAEDEAVAIAQLFNTQPLLWDDATETAVTQRMQTARIIHLATHGLLDYGTPEETGVRDFPGAIALAEGNGADGLLTSAELLGMELQADLVVLSACDTGRGNLSSDGVIGLSRALISAGVPNVMVSLWAVPDTPTADLMTEFYRQWQATGNKAQALRQAMLTTMATHPEPVNWAAFTLVGLSNK